MAGAGNIPFMAMAGGGKPKFNTARVTEVFGPWGVLVFMYWSMQGTIDEMNIKMDSMQRKNSAMEITLTKVQSDLDKYIADVNYVTNAIKDAGIVKIVR
jgi:hypothetical protein